MRDRRWRDGAALAVVALAGALGLCELWLRWSGYRPALTDREMYVASDAPHLPYRLRPNYRGVYLGQEVEIDARGQRVMRPRQELRPAGEGGRMILLVGDSVVFGHGLASDATLGAQLQNALWARGRHDRVDSIGVAGYGSWNEYAAAAEYLRNGHADVVVLVYVPNDVSYDDDQLGIGKGTYATRDTGWFHSLTQAIYGHVYVAYFAVDRIRALAQPSGAGRRSPKDTHLDDGALAHSLGGLEQLRDLCRAKGSAFLVGVYRDVWHYDDPAGSLRYEEKVENGLRSRGIAFFTLKSHVEHLALADARRAWNDAHPSAAAVHYMAEDVAGAVVGASGAVGHGQ